LVDRGLWSGSYPTFSIEGQDINILTTAAQNAHETTQQSTWGNTLSDNLDSLTPWITADFPFTTLDVNVTPIHTWVDLKAAIDVLYPVRYGEDTSKFVDNSVHLERHISAFVVTPAEYTAIKQHESWASAGFPMPAGFASLLFPLIPHALGWYYYGRRAYPRFLGGFLTLHRNSSETWHEKAKKEMHRKEPIYTLAIKYLDRALELAPTDSDSWNDKGICYVRLYRNDDANDCFQKALKYNSDHHNRDIYQRNYDVTKRE